MIIRVAELFACPGCRALLGIGPDGQLWWQRCICAAKRQVWRRIVQGHG
jgi:hypothetical protein